MEIVEKGWGHEKIIHNAGGYCGKILLRYGWTDDMSEAKELILETGDDFHVPVGLRHQMEALEETQLFEFSTTDHPDDSIRIVRGD